MHGAFGPEQPKVTVHRVLIQRDKKVDTVAHVGDLIGTGAVTRVTPAANDGLIGVVGVQVQPAAAKIFAKISPGVATPVTFPRRRYRQQRTAS